MNHSKALTFDIADGVPIKAWVQGVPFDEGARVQLEQTAKLPIVHKWVAAMPDVHKGIGATVGSVIPTRNAIIPAAVGVDIGCGMMAVRTSLKADQLPDHLAGVRTTIEKAIPHGRTSGGRRGDRGAWGELPETVQDRWKQLVGGFKTICEKHPSVENANHSCHLGTLGTGNHFVEVCLDECQSVWLMLHSGSRGIGNRIGTYFINLAREDMRAVIKNLPDRDLAYFKEGTIFFEDYIEALTWAQTYARMNRELMMQHMVLALQQSKELPEFQLTEMAVNCHHNYANMETHYDEEVWVTRKGAVSARKGEMGIIPGSMGAKSFIVRGLGNPESFHSCSHGAGRLMSRTKAKKHFTEKDHLMATRGVECRKDRGVLDETPGAYKPIKSVMAAQSDLVEIVHTLKQVVCVKG